jgi:hypothetical protein
LPLSHDPAPHSRYASSSPSPSRSFGHGSERPALHSRTVTPESPKPDLRPQLSELLKWYDEALGHIEGGAIVEPGEPERLKEERGFTARLLELLEADDRGELD